jgi:hypothetical protein
MSRRRKRCVRSFSSIRLSCFSGTGPHQLSSAPIRPCFLTGEAGGSKMRRARTKNGNSRACPRRKPSCSPRMTIGNRLSSAIVNSASKSCHYQRLHGEFLRSGSRVAYPYNSCLRFPDERRESNRAAQNSEIEKLIYSERLSKQVRLARGDQQRNCPAFFVGLPDRRKAAPPSTKEEAKPG